MGSDSDSGDIRRVVNAEGWDIGIPELEREVWLRLPADFRFRYEVLWIRAFGKSVFGANRPKPVGMEPVRRVVRTSTNQVETRGGAHSGKKLAGASEHGVIANQAAMNEIRRVERRLRVLAREMAAFLGGEFARAASRSCSVCGRRGEAEWVYCPRDGKPMMDVDAGKR